MLLSVGCNHLIIRSLTAAFKSFVYLNLYDWQTLWYLTITRMVFFNCCIILTYWWYVYCYCYTQNDGLLWQTRLSFADAWLTTTTPLGGFLWGCEATYYWYMKRPTIVLRSDLLLLEEATYNTLCFITIRLLSEALFVYVVWLLIMQVFATLYTTRKGIPAVWEFVKTGSGS